MKNSRIFVLISWVFLCSVLCSCAGNPKNEKKIFSALIIDEKSNPVADMEVNVKSGTGNRLKVWTDPEGMFFLSEEKAGSFHIHGEKSGFTVLDENVEVRNLDKIYCFQVQSADSVLDEVESLLVVDRNKEAIKKLDLIFTERNKNLKECVSFYKKKISKEKK